MIHAKLNDIVELSNGLKMKIVKDTENSFYNHCYYKTIDINNNDNVTTYISEKELEKLIIGETTWGYGCDKFEIINIIDGTDLPYILFYDENELGKIVRNAWIEWAKEQPNPKPSWLVPYEELSQPDKDADIRIGKAVVEQCNKCIPAILKQNKSI